MHELAAAQDVVRAVLAVAEEQGAQRINVIALKVGSLYSADNLQDLIAIAAKGTIAEGATVEVEAVPGSAIQVASIDVE
jgi:Zn finger protein HypA/HybF involved in hydrogenase expression